MYLALSRITNGEPVLKCSFLKKMDRHLIHASEFIYSIHALLQKSVAVYNLTTFPFSHPHPLVSLYKLVLGFILFHEQSPHIIQNNKKDFY